MTEQSKDTLTPAQKLEITTYVGSLLKGWLAWIGVANLAVLGGALIYIFFILPGKAVSEATSRVEGDIARITQNLATQVETNLVRFGRASEKIANLERELQQTADRAGAIRKDVDDIEKGKLSEAARFLKALGDNPRIARIVTRIERLEEKPATLLLTTGGEGKVSLQKSNSWGVFPDLRLDIELSKPQVVIAFYQVTMSGASSHLVTRLLIDGTERAHARAITGNTAYWSPSSVWMGELPEGKHTFAVEYRTPAGGENAPGASDWHTRVLSVAALGG